MKMRGVVGRQAGGRCGHDTGFDGVAGGPTQSGAPGGFGDRVVGLFNRAVVAGIERTKCYLTGAGPAAGTLAFGRSTLQTDHRPARVRPCVPKPGLPWD